MKTQTVDARTAATAQLEAQLRENEARFRALFESCSDALFVVDKEGTILDANPSACQLHAAERETLRGQNVLDLASGTWETETIHLVAEAITGTSTQASVPLSNNAELGLYHLDYDGQTALLIHLRDIAERQRVARTLEMRNRDLLLLNQASQVLSSTLDLDEVLAAILDQVRQIMGATASSIWLVDEKTNELVCKDSTEPGVLRGWRMARSAGIVGWTTVNERSLLVPDTRLDMRHYKAVDQKSGKEIRCILSVPLKVKQRTIGSLQLVDLEPNCFHEEDISIMESLATTAAIAIENAQLFEQVQEDAETRAMLVHEINHRVKNNLSSIIGLLYSEKRYARTEDPASYQTLLQDLIGRIQGMAQVHAMLSATEWLPLPLDELTQRMVNTALQILPQRISVAVDVTPTSISVPPKQATNMALVINELTTNTIKYALDGRASVTITVRIIVEPDDMVRFEFHNDGSDYPPEVLSGDRRNLGLYLVQTLVERGLGGTLELRNDHGPVTIIRFRRA